MSRASSRLLTRPLVRVSPVQRTVLRATSLVLLTAVLGVVYLPFASADFVGTDVLTSIDTSRLLGWADVVRIWTQPFMAGSSFVATDALLYRPLVAMSFGLDYALWGLNPWGYHLSNTIWHAVAALMAFAFLVAIGLRWWTAWLGMALYGLHPAMMGAVPVIARRHDSIASAALLGALALLCADARRPRSGASLAYLGSVSLWAVALVGKESTYGAAPLLPAVLGAVWRLAGAGLRRDVWAYVRYLAPHALVALVVLGVRFAVLGDLGGHREVPIGRFDLVDYRLVLNKYVAYLFWPFHDVYPPTAAAWLALLGVGLPAAAVAVGALPARSRVHVALGIVWLAAFGGFFMAIKTLSGPWYYYYVLPGGALVVGGILEGAMDRLRGSGRRPVRTALVLGLLTAAAVYVVGVMAWSPLVRPYPEWPLAGQVTRRYLDGLAACATSLPTGTRVRVRDAPYLVENATEQANFVGITWFQQYSVESALRLAFPQKSLTVEPEPASSFTGFDLADAATLRVVCSESSGSSVISVERR